LLTVVVKKYFDKCLLVMDLNKSSIAASTKILLLDTDQKSDVNYNIVSVRLLIG